jgi:sec-independent protein translocase protein TatA
MGLGGISIWQLLIILAIVMLIFGTKRLKGLGGDLGGAIKSFRKAMDTDAEKDQAEDKDKDQEDEAATKQLPADGEPDAEFAEQKDKERHG